MSWVETSLSTVTSPPYGRNGAFLVPRPFDFIIGLSSFPVNPTSLVIMNYHVGIYHYLPSYSDLAHPALSRWYETSLETRGTLDVIPVRGWNRVIQASHPLLVPIPDPFNPEIQVKFNQTGVLCSNSMSSNASWHQFHVAKMIRTARGWKTKGKKRFQPIQNRSWSMARGSTITMPDDPPWVPLSAIKSVRGSTKRSQGEN